MKKTLAQVLQCDFHANLIDFLREIMFSQSFHDRHRRSIVDFSRESILNFPNMILFLMNLLKGSIQDELDIFFKSILQLEVHERIVTKQVFSKGRKKLNHQTFIELNDSLNSFFNQNHAPLKWNNFRLVSIDGSTVKVPKTDPAAGHFGSWNPEKGESCPIARISQSFDVLNHVTIDALIRPKSEGERELLVSHLQKSRTDDLYLVDRGYPAFWIFKLIQSRSANFCARVSYTTWNETKEFFASGKRDKTVFLHPSTQSKMKCQELGLDTKPIKVRLIRVTLDNNTTEILITSLTDCTKYQTDIFADLYHKRWPVEEDYKVMKCRIQVENFSGKSVHSVYQDFHAKVLAKNLSSIAAYQVTEQIEQKHLNCKHPYQINFTQVLSKMKNTIVLLFLRSKDEVLTIISKLKEIFVKTAEPIRPGRKYPRKHKVQRKGFFISYKQTS